MRVSDSNTKTNDQRAFIEGIFVGVIIDVFGGFFVEFVIGLGYTLYYSMITGSFKEAIGSQPTTSQGYPLYLLISILSYTLVPYTAGYVCALTSKYKVNKCAIIVGIITSSTGILIGATANVPNALLKSLFRNIISFCFIVYGARRWEKTD